MDETVEKLKQKKHYVALSRLKTPTNWTSSFLQESRCKKSLSEKIVYLCYNRWNNSVSQHFLFTAPLLSYVDIWRHPSLNGQIGMKIKELN